MNSESFTSTTTTTTLISVKTVLVSEPIKGMEKLSSKFVLYEKN